MTVIPQSQEQARREDRIESLLSARLFLEPQLVDGRLYFISSLSGHLSLFAMDAEGGVPEPLLPPQIALQNPELIGGLSFFVLPELDQILVMIDHDGDEIYRPFVIPLGASRLLWEIGVSGAGGADIGALRRRTNGTRRRSDCRPSRWRR